MEHDGRALSEESFEKIQEDWEHRFINTHSTDRLIQTVKIQREVLKELFGFFRQESPLRRVHVSDPVRSSHLNHLKELVSMETK